jgi:hypothetical protein
MHASILLHICNARYTVSSIQQCLSAYPTTRTP